MVCPDDWFKDDTLWATVAPYMFNERMWAVVPEDIDLLLNLLQLEPPADVLDLCCGPGRYTLELARRGFQMTGVDLTEKFITDAAQHAKVDGLNAEFIHEDMREFRRERAFDIVLNLFTSFGYFEDQTDDRKVLDNICQSLKPGGRLVMEMMGKEVLARIYRRRDWTEKDNGVLFLEERNATRDWTWMQNRWIIIDGTTRHDFSIGHRVYSAAELALAIQESGFKEITIYGSLAGIPYDHEAKRLVAVARK